MVDFRRFICLGNVYSAAESPVKPSLAFFTCTYRCFLLSDDTITAVLKGSRHGRKQGKTFILSTWFCIGCSAHQQPPGNTCEQSRLQWTHQDPEILHPPSGHAALLRQTLCCNVRSYQVQPPLFTPQAHPGNTAASTSYERRDICSLAIFHLTKWWWKLEP